MSWQRGLIGLKVRLKPLAGDNSEMQVEIAHVSPAALRVLTEAPLAVGTPVELEADDLIVLGEVSSAVASQGHYTVTLGVSHCFTLTADLLRLARQMRGDFPAPSFTAEEQSVGGAHSPERPQ